MVLTLLSLVVMQCGRGVFCWKEGLVCFSLERDSFMGFELSLFFLWEG